MDNTSTTSGGQQGGEQGAAPKAKRKRGSSQFLALLDVSEPMAVEKTYKEVAAGGTKKALLAALADEARGIEGKVKVVCVHRSVQVAKRTVTAITNLKGG